MSRSGLVMSALLLNGADGPAAGEFAGLMGIPVFLAAGLIQLLGAGTGAGESPRTAILLLGLCLSALSAYFTLRVFTEALSHRKPALYAYWSWGAGILALILFLISA
jgi:undecaprenyl-diphosphatase